METKPLVNDMDGTDDEGEDLIGEEVVDIDEALKHSDEIHIDEDYPVR